MVFCISASDPPSAFLAGEGAASGSGLFAGSAPGASAVLMIFTSPAVAVSVGGAIGGFVITGFGAAGLGVRRVRFLLVCASASTKQQLTSKKAATKNFM